HANGSQKWRSMIMVDQIRSMQRPDVVAVPSAPRPTPAPARIPFKQILATAGIRAAQSAMTVLPGAPVLATALRGPALPVTTSAGGGVLPMSGHAAAAPAVSLAPEGPAAAGADAALGGAAGDPQSALAQAQANEMDMLRLQMQVASQQNHFTVMSNILK